MPSTTAEAKRTLRRAVRARLAGLTAQELRHSDQCLFDRFLALPQVGRAKTVFMFWGIPGREPDTARLVPRLLELDKHVYLPRMLPGHQMEVRRYDPARPLVPAAFDILEPDGACPLAAPEDIDLALVPALCYDRRGYRLGFGGGYYDRWLSRFSGDTVGLCRQVVLQERVPLEPHDRCVELLLTETHCLIKAKSGA